MSKIIKCENGHFFDQDKYGKCPYCPSSGQDRKQIKVKGVINDDMDDMVTVAPSMFGGTARKINRPHVTGQTIKPRAGIFAKEAEALKSMDREPITDQMKRRPSVPDDEKTVSLFTMKHGVTPVTGWLVCIRGEEKGKDYRLVAGFNHVGRDPKMDVCLKEDQLITRDTHCSLAYDHKENSFFLVPGKGTLTYLNGTLTSEPARLSDGDQIEMGQTALVLVCYCKGERKWEE